MKILLDENLPHDFATSCPVTMFTQSDTAGGAAQRTESFLPLAAQAGFAAMVTMDTGVRYRQNLTTLPLTVVILSAASNDIDDLRPLIPELLDALNNMKPMSIIRIP